MKKILSIVIVLLICLNAFCSCDPKYPPGNLKIEKIEDLSIGESVEIKIIYPNSGGSVVLDWKDQNVEITEGADIIEISGLTVKGLKAGTAVIRVSATTVISEFALEQGFEEKIYSTTAKITVR